MLSVTPYTERDGSDAAFGGEPAVAGAVLVQEVGRIALALRGPAQPLNLRAVMVGVVGWVEVVDGDRDAGLTEGRCRRATGGFVRLIGPQFSASSGPGSRQPFPVSFSSGPILWAALCQRRVDSFTGGVRFGVGGWAVWRRGACSRHARRA